MPLIGYSFADFPNRFRRDMEQCGFTVIEPDDGTFKAFTLKNWEWSSFLARKGNVIYMAMIEARRRRQGALRQLMNEIEREHELRVLAPLGILESILIHYGFEPHRELFGLSTESVWRRRA